MKKVRIPQYAKDFMWKDYNEENDEEQTFTVSTMYAFEKYISYELYYSFNIKDKHHHEHRFSEILKFVFDFPESFILNEENKNIIQKNKLNLSTSY